MVSNGIKLVFFFGATTGITAVLLNKVVKSHPSLASQRQAHEEIAACEPMAGIAGKR